MWDQLRDSERPCASSYCVSRKRRARLHPYRLSIPVTFLFLSVAALGQEATSPVLQGMLDTLSRNREVYSSQIPDFACAEHVVSHLDTGKHFEHQQIAVSDATFRLQRVSSATQPALLVESRSEMRINGTASSRTELSGPLALINVFSRALDGLSPSQAGCATYSMETSAGSQGNDFAKIHFESVPSRLGPPGCAFAEFASGTITFDTRLQQTTRIDVTIPHHVIASNYFGKWSLSVQYGPVILNEHTYWLPQQVASTLTSAEEENVVWWIKASYSDFHRYTVQSHILMPSEVIP